MIRGRDKPVKLSNDGTSGCLGIEGDSSSILREQREQSRGERICGKGSSWMGGSKSTNFVQDADSRGASMRVWEV